MNWLKNRLDFANYCNEIHNSNQIMLSVYCFISLLFNLHSNVVTFHEFTHYFEYAHQSKIRKTKTTTTTTIKTTKTVRKTLTNAIAKEWNLLCFNSNKLTDYGLCATAYILRLVENMDWINKKKKQKCNAKPIGVSRVDLHKFGNSAKKESCSTTAKHTLSLD